MTSIRKELEVAKEKVAWKFQYIGTDEVATGLEDITRKGKQVEDPEVLVPGDVVVVDDPDTRDWLRSLTNFQEQESPTDDKATHHKKPPAKKKPGRPAGSKNKPKPKKEE